MIVYASQLLHAASRVKAAKATLANGVVVTAAQLRKAGEILRDSPQPFCNGLKSDMPGFIEPEAQTGRSLTFQVGILPARLYRIDVLGRARAVTP